jgi:hypothetical protein
MRPDSRQRAFYWSGAAVFAAMAVWQLPAAVALATAVVGSGAGGIGAVSGGVGDIVLLIVLPLVGNRLIASASRGTRSAAGLVRAHAVLLLVLVLAPIALFAIGGRAGFWAFVLIPVLIPLQLAVLAAAYAALALAPAPAAAA